jgi:hypothetical protein
LRTPSENMTLWWLDGDQNVSILVRHGEPSKRIDFVKSITFALHSKKKEQKEAQTLPFVVLCSVKN